MRVLIIRRIGLGCNRHLRGFISSIEWRTSSRNYSPHGSNIIKSPYPEVNAPFNSLTEFVWKDLDKWSSKIAIQCAETGQSYTYAKLRKLCALFANALKKKKFHRGHVLSVVLPNLADYPVVLLGSVEAGLTVSTINPNFTPGELSRQFEDSKTVVIVTLTSLVDKVQQAIQIIEQKSKSPFPVTIITLNDNAQSVSCMFKEMINEQQPHNEAQPLDAHVQPDDVAFLPYSSGTTGMPKGVQLTHANLVNNLLQLSHDNVKVAHPAEANFQDVIPAAIPFFHIFGISSLILTSLMNGCKIVSLKKFEPERYLNIITRDKATILYLVPSLALFLSSNPSILPNGLQRVRSAFCAGGNFPVSTLDKLYSLSGSKMNIKNAYGLTEASPGVCISEDGNPLNSVGYPLPNTRLKVVDENGVLQSSYQWGEICVAGPQVMKGYLNNPDATTKVIDEDGFLHTGDVGYYNDEGQFFCVDRIKELIKVKGFQVAPAELESIIITHKAVKDVCVIGVPDERCGEKPVAFVVAENSKYLQEIDLKRYVAENVATYKQLADVIFIDSIPRNPSGKILRRILRERYTSSV